MERSLVGYSPGGHKMERSLVGYSPWGRKELDTTKHTGLLPFVLLACRSSLYTLDSNPFSLSILRLVFTIVIVSSVF